MNIHITQADAPNIPKEILADLSAMVPRVFLEWNPRLFKANDTNGVYWEGRWEIWCKLEHSTHPDARNARYVSDRWNTDVQCWMRKLQVYQTEGGDFAPADRGLIVGLNMADTWANRLFYEEHVIAPNVRIEEARMAVTREMVSAGSSYYRNFNNPIVGSYGGTRGWRWRDR